MLTNDPATAATVILKYFFPVLSVKNLNNQPATVPIKILGNIEIKGLTKTIAAKGLVGQTKALIKVMTPQIPPIIDPYLVPKTKAVTITVMWIIVRFSGPIGIYPKNGMKF